MNQEQIKEEKSSILTLLVSSILLHILLIFALILYRLSPDVLPERPRISPQDNVVLWTSPTPKTMPTPQPPTPQAQPKKIEEKPKEPDFNFLKKAPIIKPGSQGVDEQHTTGINSPIQTTNQTIEEKKEIPKPINPTIQNKSETETITDKVSHKNNTLPENKSSPISTSSKEFSQYPLKFDTDLKNFLNAKSIQQENVSQKTKKSSVKSISFKDIGLGFNNAATNIGNSQNLIMNGTSSDIPQGDELKYITFIHQMAKMLITSIDINPKRRLITHRTYEKIRFFMKINRSGQLLETYMVTPSQYEIINEVIIDSVKNVGLFNQIPKFIKENTFGITWEMN